MIKYFRMRKSLFILALFFTMPVFAGSFLKAQSFPKTFQDLSFSDRMQFKMDDYELYQPEYDANGNCISGCAYPGINIIQEHETSNTDTQQALQQSESYQQQSANMSSDTQAIINAINTTNRVPTCINRNTNIPVGQAAPFGKPLVGNPRISSPYGPRILHGKQSYHDGIDFAVPVGTKIYSPADATVVRIIDDNRCGKGVRLQHKDGTQSIYCHLNRQLVSKGDQVEAGCQIAESGNTGHSTGPHLHYGLRNSAGKKIDPTPYINR